MPEIELELPDFKPKQLEVFRSKATEILFAGDTRAGKSYFLRKAYIIWCSQIPGLLCDIYRVNWDDVIRNYMLGETSFPVLLAPWVNAGLVQLTQSEIRFWNGSQINLYHCADDSVARSKQGNPVHVRALDESAQMTEYQIRTLGGWVSMTEEMKAKLPPKYQDAFPKFFHLTNFVGQGMPYYRRNFLECREPYKIEKVGQFQRQFIPAYLADNDAEDAQAVIARIKEAFPDPAIQKAYLECDWRAAAGDMYPEWSEKRHVVSDFWPPSHWFRYRSFDWGTADPFCVYWIAVSDGEPFRDHDGIERWFPRGCRVFYNEWYGNDPENPAKGNRMRNEDIAQGILNRSEYEHRNVITLTDNLPFQDRGGETIADTFMKNGVPLTLGDTSRVPGWAQLRNALIGKELDKDEDGNIWRVPMAVFCECCSAARLYMPALMRHPSEKKREDAQEHGEATHSPDAIRIGMMAHTIIKDLQLPTDARIKRQLVQSKPTIRRIIREQGGRFF